MDAVTFVEKLAAGCAPMKVRKPVSRTSKPGSLTSKWSPGHRYQGATTKTAKTVADPAVAHAENMAGRRADELVDDKSTMGAVADYLAPATWGHSRAGRAAQVGDTIGADVGFNLRNPLTALTAGGVGGGIVGGLGGAALAGATGMGETDGMITSGLGGGLGAGLGIALSAFMRRRNMSQINTKLKGHLAAGQPLKSKAPQYGVLSSLLFPGSGGFRAGQADAHEAMTDDQPYQQTTGRNLVYGAEEGLSRINPLAVAPISMARGWTQNFGARDRMAPKVAFIEKLADPSALTGNLGGVFQGPHGSGLLPPSPGGGIAPNVTGGSPSVTGAKLPSPKPQLTPPAPASPPKMPQLSVPPPDPGAMPGGTAVPGAAGPTVAQKPVDVSAPGMMDKSHIAPSLTAQFDQQRAQQMGMHADGMPVPKGPAGPPVVNQRPQLANGVPGGVPGGGVPIPAAQPAAGAGLVKQNAAEAWGETIAKQIGGKHRVRTLEEYDAKPGDFARRLAEAGA